MPSLLWRELGGRCQDPLFLVGRVETSSDKVPGHIKEIKDL